MRKGFIVFLIMFLGVFSACSEEAPDGSVEMVYYPFFEEKALESFQYVLYPEKSGLLLSAYSEDMEIAVTVEQDADAADEEAFLTSYVNGISRYAVQTNTPRIYAWNESEAMTGAKTQIHYRSNKATAEDEGYLTDAFAVKLEGEMYLLIVFNSWTENGQSAMADAEESFFETFSLEQRAVSKVCLAQVKNARENDDGDQYAVLDFCSVMYDETFSMVYAQNKTEENTEYKISPDALIWSPDINASLYTMSLVKPEAENLVETAAYYYETMGFDIIYQVMFNADNEIVWMMHYNAF